MKSSDTVNISGGNLVAHFGSTGLTGSLVVLPLSGIRLSRNGVTIEAAWSAGLPKVVEFFTDEHTARNAFDRVLSLVGAHVRSERIRAVGAGFAKYVALPLGLILLGLAMNVAVHTRPTSQTTDGSVVPAGSLVATDRIAAPLPPPSARVTPEMPAVGQAAIAQALKQGADSGKFAVQLGSSNGDPIFVFEDPLCPHCQEFAPELAKVAKTHTVYVFPTSVVGGEDAVPVAALALCAPPAQREAMWGKALSGALLASGPNGHVAAATPECSSAVMANNEIFARMGLMGTPTIFDSKGRMMPYTAPQTAESVLAWAAGA